MEPGIILTAASSLFALYWLNRTDDRRVFLITAGIVISFILILIHLPGNFSLRYVGVAIYQLMLVVILLYGLLNNILSAKEKLLITLIVLPILSYTLLKILHLPGAGFIQLLQGVSVISYILCLFQKPLMKETGFLTILAAQALTGFISVLVAII